jgi:hypothetical protein
VTVADRIVLVVRRKSDAAALFPGGVPKGVEVRSAHHGGALLEGMSAGLVLLGPGLDARAVDVAHGVARSAGGAVAELRR